MRSQRSCTRSARRPATRGPVRLSSASLLLLILRAPSLRLIQEPENRVLVVARASGAPNLRPWSHGAANARRNTEAMDEERDGTFPRGGDDHAGDARSADA